MGLVILVVVVVAGPPLVIRASRPDIQNASAADQLKAENDLHGTLVTMLAGIAVGAGTVVAALNLNLQRRGQVTERFSKAIDQLGRNDQLDVRIGGIYALEQIALDSRDLHGPVMEVLTAYVREQAPTFRARSSSRPTSAPRSSVAPTSVAQSV